MKNLHTGGENEKTGLIIPLKNSDALSKAIIKLLSRPDKLIDYTNNIKEKNRTGYYSWPSIAEKTTILPFTQVTKIWQ